MEETSTGKARTTVDPEETLDSMVVAAPVEPDTAQTCSGPPNNSVKEPEDYSVDFRSWFDCLREVTFTTHFLALRSQELRALATFYDAFFPFYFRALQRHEKDTPVAEPTMSWLECKILRASCGEEHMQALDALAARIDDFLTNGGFTAPENLFCKLTTRAPKDSLALRRRGERASGETDSAPPMACQCGLDMVELLATSQRVREDIAAYSNLALVVRPWVKIPLWTEFRCFVYGGKVTAICQYAASSIFPELQDTAVQQSIGKGILSFLNGRVLPRLPAKLAAKSVIDVAALEGGFFVIELNPFAKSTGASMFSWVHDGEPLKSGFDNDQNTLRGDLQVIVGASTAFRVRTQQEPIADALS